LSQHVVCRLSVTFCIVACMTGRPQMFAPTRAFSGMADSTELCKMLRGINAEIQSPTGLSVCLSVTFYVVAKRHILAKNWLKEQIGLPPETTPRYQFGPPSSPIRIKDFACFCKPCVMFIISRSIRVRVTFMTVVRIACRYLHWINSNPNTDPNPNPNPSVPAY